MTEEGTRHYAVRNDPKRNAYQLVRKIDGHVIAVGLTFSEALRGAEAFEWHNGRPAYGLDGTRIDEEAN